MKIAQMLKTAKAVIADPDHWCKGAMARDADFINTCEVHSQYAVMYCSVGAIRKLYGYTDLADQARHFLDRAATAVVGDEDIIDYNDRHSHSEVMHVWDEAIKQATAEGV